MFASLNDVHRYPLPDEKTGVINRNAIVIDAANVTVEPTANNGLPRVAVDATIAVPTLFAGIFGFDGMQIRGKATASIFSGGWRNRFDLGGHVPRRRRLAPADVAGHVL